MSKSTAKGNTASAPAKAKAITKSKRLIVTEGSSKTKPAASICSTVMGKARTVRIDARIPSHVKEIVQYAASIQGRTQTDFMVTAIQEAAQKVIADSSVIQLCLEDQRALAGALQNEKELPATKGLARLRRVVRDHDKKVKSL